MAKIATHLRTFAIAVLILLTANAFAATKAPELQQLREQLKKAQDAEDKPAIIELSRRIVAIAPNDAGTWNTLAQTQFESEELDGLERTLDAWQKAFKRLPAAIVPIGATSRRFGLPTASCPSGTRTTRQPSRAFR